MVELCLSEALLKFFLQANFWNEASQYNIYQVECTFQNFTNLQIFSKSLKFPSVIYTFSSTTMSTFNHLLMIILSNIYLLPVQVKSSSGSDSKQMQTPPSGCFCVDANCNFLDCSQNESSSLSSTYTYTSYQCDRSYRDGHRKFPMHLNDVLQVSWTDLNWVQVFTNGLALSTFFEKKSYPSYMCTEFSWFHVVPSKE